MYSTMKNISAINVHILQEEVIFREFPVQNYSDKRRNPIKLPVYRVYNGSDHETVLYDFPMCSKTALGKLTDPFIQRLLTLKFQESLEKVVKTKHPKAVPYIKFVHINDSKKMIAIFDIVVFTNFF